MDAKSKSNLEQLSRDIELFARQFRERGDALVNGLYRDIDRVEDEANALDRDMEAIEKDGINAIDQAILGFFEACGSDLPEGSSMV